MSDEQTPTSPLLHTEPIINFDEKDPKNIGTPSRYFLAQWDLQRELNTEIAGIVDLTARVDALELVTSANVLAIGALQAINLIAGTGLDGGGNLSGPDRTFDLADTAVTPGSYTNVDITVDQQGRITDASNGTPGGSFRGALIHLDANASTDTTWPKFLDPDTEDYDTDDIWDDVTNTTRLTVPTGVTRVKLTGAALITSETGAVGVFISIYKNGTDSFYPGSNSLNINADAAGFANKAAGVSTAVIPVVATDYFELRVNVFPTYDGGFLADASISMEIIE